MLTFDGVSREVCTVRRIRTNTPLQALTSLNDSANIDIARHFARRMQDIGGSVAGNQINKGYNIATNNSLNEDSKKALINLYRKAYEKFKDDPDNTCKMNGGNGYPNDAETAALTVVANAILNLDEVVTKN